MLRNPHHSLKWRAENNPQPVWPREGGPIAFEKFQKGLSPPGALFGVMAMGVACGFVAYGDGANFGQEHFSTSINSGL